MSGGSMNYVYSRIETDAKFDLDTAEKRAFRKHLDLVIKALHDIEWVESGDYSPGDENAAIRACLGKDDVLKSEIEWAQSAIDSVNREWVKLSWQTQNR